MIIIISIISKNALMVDGKRAPLVFSPTRTNELEQNGGWEVFGDMERMVNVYIMELRRLINEKKQELYRFYREQGISSKVLKLSTDLDKLIYEYQMLSAPLCFKKNSVQN